MKGLRLMMAFVLAAALSGGAAWGIELGDPAPALKIAEWIKGQPVNLADAKGKNIVLLDFWATWCGPCKASIPHLTDVQAKYKDKGVVLVSISDEPTATVKPFVEKAGDKMGYTVACDDGAATFDAYLKAFKLEGIPHAFIIDKSGLIAWSGSPFDPGMETSIDAMLAGKYDLKAAKEEARKAEATRKMLVEYFELVTDGSDMAKANKIGNQIVIDGAKNAQLLNYFSWTILTDQRIEKRDLELATRAAKSAYDACEGGDPAIVDTYARALFDTGKRSEAITLQTKAVQLCTDERMKAELEKTLNEYKAKTGK